MRGKSPLIQVMVLLTRLHVAYVLTRRVGRVGVGRVGSGGGARPRRRGQSWRPGVQLRTRNPTPSEFFPTWWWRGTHNRFLKRGWRENYICSCLECDGGRQTVPLSAGTCHNPGVGKFSVHTMLKLACPRKNRYHRHPECVTLLQLSPPTLWILRRADFYDARRIRPLHDVQVGHCFIYWKPYVKGWQAGRHRWMERWRERWREQWRW